MSSTWHNVIHTLSHPDDLAPSRISSRWIMGIAQCHLPDLRYCRMSSGWHNVIKVLSYPDELVWWYLIRMIYGQCSMSSGWPRCTPTLESSGQNLIFHYTLWLISASIDIKWALKSNMKCTYRSWIINSCCAHWISCNQYKKALVYTMSNIHDKL